MEIGQGRRLRSYKERCQRIERLLARFFGKKLLSDITGKDVEDLRVARSVGHALDTVSVDHNLLKHVIKHAMKRDLVGRNVACLVSAPERNNRRDRVLEQCEWDRLYTAAPVWFKPIVMTGYQTGMRLEKSLR